MSASNYIEYFVLSYVPHVSRGEVISIAAIFFDSIDLEKGICTMSFAPDWQNKVQGIDSDADLEMLQALLKEIRDRLLSPSQRYEIIRQMEDSFSNLVQLSQRRKCPVAPTPESIEAFSRELLQERPKKSPGLTGMCATTCQSTL